MDIAVGVAYLLWLTLREYNNTENELAVFMGASIASTFWFYKQTHDYVILILPCMILLHNIHRMQGRDFGKRLGAIVSIIFVFYVQSLARKIFCLILPSCTDAFSKELFMTFTCIFLMIMGVICTEEHKRPR
jgi:hypothetical protein